MFTIRKAVLPDHPGIIRLLKELDLYYADLILLDFWIAEELNNIIGTVQLANHKDFFFLGSLGVAPPYQKKGIGTALLKETIKNARKDIYLYTIIPEYFRKFGFQVTAPSPDLPSKDRYECADCHLEKCVCMVKPFQNQKGNKG